MVYSFDKVFFYSLKAFKVVFGYVSVALQKVNYTSQCISHPAGMKESERTHMYVLCC